MNNSILERLKNITPEEIEVVKQVLFPVNKSELPTNLDRIEALEEVVTILATEWFKCIIL